jgi:hypothetical protein
LNAREEDDDFHPPLFSIAGYLQERFRVAVGFKLISGLRHKPSPDISFFHAGAPVALDQDQATLRSGFSSIRNDYLKLIQDETDTALEVLPDAAVDP